MSSTFLIRVDGPAQIYVGPSDCNASQFPASLANFKALGVTENGLQISINTLTHRVNSDDMGGGEGNPAEMLVMGTAGTIRGVMVKYGSLALADLMTGLYGGTEGRTPIPGTPIFASGYGFGVVVRGAARSYYFPKSELASTPREFNVSSTERKTSFTFNAHPIYLGTNSTSGVIYIPDNTGTLLAPECSDAYGGSTQELVSSGT